MTMQILPEAWQRWLLVVLVLMAVFAFILFTPWNLGGLSSDPNPAQNYNEALRRITVLQAGEADLNPVCKTQFMTHGQKVPRTIIFVHGYTTCPQQFNELGQRFYALGYNVLIVPVPHHGLLDRMTDDQAKLTAEELAAYADEVMDIGDGLGDQVIMAGISLGGVTTAWAAQNRADLYLGVLISPGFGFKQIPTALTVPVANVFEIIPPIFQWWDPVLKEAGGPSYAYPRYSTSSLGQIMRLGFAVRAAARQRSPAAHAILVVTNANDTAVNNELTAQVVQDWRGQGANLSTFEFGVELGLSHDIVDPNDKSGNIALVYPRLVELIDK